MTNPAAPIAFRLHGTTPAIAGPESVIRPALAGAQPITINHGKLAGDQVLLGTAYAPEPGTGCGWTHRTVLAQFEHPKFGTILVAPINMTELAGAPKLAAVDAGVTADVTAAEKRIAADDARLAKLDRNI